MKHIRLLNKSVLLYFPATSMVILLYVLIVYLDQGKDTLVSTGEKPFQLIVLFFSLLFWSFIVWYSSRIMSNVPIKGELKTIEIWENGIIPWFPRFLGYNCYVVIQIGILSLPTVLSLNTFQQILLFAVHFAIFFFGKEAIFAKKNWSHLGYKVYVILIAVYSLYLIWVCYKMSKEANTAIVSHQINLTHFAMATFFAQIMTLLFYLKRKGLRKKFGINVYFHTLESKFESFLKFMGLPDRHYAREKGWFMLLHILTAISIIGYIFILAVPELSITVGPLAIVVFFLAFLTGLFNLIKSFSRKYDFNVNISILILIFLVAGRWDMYEVKYAESNEANPFENRLGTEEFFELWTNERKVIFETDSLTDVFLVLSDGGASRAAKWAGMVLGDLHDKSDGAFSQRIFSIAGASGGTVGNCYFYRLLKESKQGKISQFQNQVNTFFEKDFLSYPLAYFLGPDIFKYYLFQNTLTNRADALEKAFETNCDDGVFSKNLEHVLDFSGKLPALIITTTTVQEAMPGIISNLKLPESDAFHFDVLNTLCPYKSLKFSTAMLLSARFPFFSPAGKVGDRYYVDGGYLDNTGAMGTLTFIRELYKSKANMKAEQRAYLDKIRWNIIRLKNDSQQDPVPTRLPGISNDLFAPFFTLTSMQGSSTKSGLHQLRSYFKDDSLSCNYYEFNLQVKNNDPNEGKKDIYSMNWLISNHYALQFDRAMTEEENQVQRNEILFCLNSF